MSLLADFLRKGKMISNVVQTSLSETGLVNKSIEFLNNNDLVKKKSSFQKTFSSLPQIKKPIKVGLDTILENGNIIRSFPSMFPKFLTDKFRGNDTEVKATQPSVFSPGRFKIQDVDLSEDEREQYEGLTTPERELYEGLGDPLDKKKFLLRPDSRRRMIFSGDQDTQPIVRSPTKDESERIMIKEKYPEQERVSLYNLPDYLLSKSQIVRTISETMELGAFATMDVASYGLVAPASKVAQSFGVDSAKYIDKDWLRGGRSTVEYFPQLAYYSPAISMDLGDLGEININAVDILDNLGMARGAGKVAGVVGKKAPSVLSKVGGLGMLKKGAKDVAPVLNNVGKVGAWIAGNVLYDFPMGFLSKVKRKDETWGEDIKERFNLGVRDLVTGIIASAVLEGGGKGLNLGKIAVSDLETGKNIGKTMVEDIKILDILPQDRKKFLSGRLKELGLTMGEEMGARIYMFSNITFPKVLTKGEQLLEKGLKKGEDVAKSVYDYFDNLGGGVKLPKQLKVEEYLRDNTGMKIYGDNPTKVKEVVDEAMDFNLDGYLKELKEQVVLARKKERVGLLQGTKNFLTEVENKFINRDAPLERLLEANMKQYNYELLPGQDIRNQVWSVRNVAQKSNVFLKEHGYQKIINSVKDVDAFDEYMKARQVMDVTAQNPEYISGRNLIKDKMMIEQLSHLYEKQALEVNNIYKDILNMLVDSKVVSGKVRDDLFKKYPRYVPLDRIMDLFDTGDPYVKMTPEMSISQQKSLRSLKGGSELVIDSPIKNVYNKTLLAFAEAERNRSFNMVRSYKDLPSNPLDLEPIRTKEGMEIRLELKEINEKIGGELKSLKKDKASIKMLLEDIKEFKGEGLEIIEEQFKTLMESRSPKGDSELDLPVDILAKRFIDALIKDPTPDLKLVQKLLEKRNTKLEPFFKTVNEASAKIQILKNEKLIEKQRLIDLELKKLGHGDQTLTGYNEGVKEVWKVNPDVARVAKNLGYEQVGILGRLLRSPLRLAKMGITGLSVPFLFRNLIRDQFTAFTVSDNGARTTLLNPFNFVRALYDVVGKSSLYDEMVKSGGGSGTSLEMLRGDTYHKTFERMRADKDIKSKIAYRIKHPIQSAGEYFRMVEDVINVTEKMTRMAQYRGTKKYLMGQGRTETDAKILAAKASRENTVNFGRHGEWGGVVNAGWLYGNAQIQGSRLLVKTFKDKPLETVIKVASTMYFPTAVATLWNLATEDRSEAYRDIKEHEKDLNFIIVPPNPTKNEDGTWNVIKISKPQGWGDLANPIRIIIEQSQGVNELEFKDIADSLFGAVSPINKLDSGGIASTFTPHLIKGGLEVFTGKEFFTGYDVEPEAMQDVEKGERYKKDTSYTAGMLGSVTGLSPIQAQHLVKSYTGEVGLQALHYSDKMLNKAGVIEEAQIGGRSIGKGLERAFTLAGGGTSSEERAKPLEEYYEEQETEKFKTRQADRKLYADIKEMEVSQRIQILKAIKAEDPDQFDRLEKLNEIDKQQRDTEYYAMGRLNISNGTRVKAIFQEGKKLEGKDRGDYNKRLQEQGLLTEKVKEQLDVLIAKDKGISDKFIRSKLNKLSTKKKKESYLKRLKESKVITDTEFSNFEKQI